jgi:hypothetical protein
MQAALKDVSHGKLVVTIADGKPLGYTIEKSEKFEKCRLTVTCKQEIIILDD